MNTGEDSPGSTHSFGYWVRRRRLALDLTQSALARRVGCSPSTIKKIERDERRPSRTTAGRLAECLVIPEADREVFVSTALSERAPHRLPLTADPVGGRRPRPEPPSDPVAALGRASDAEGLAFVGRAAELGELRRWWDRPPGEVAIVSGEAGVGKTRLVAEFIRDVADGCTVLYGRADEGAGSSYEPVLGALRQLVRTAPDDNLDALSTTACAALFRLVPEMAERRPEAAAVAAGWTEIDRSWLLGAVADALGALPDPVLVVADDLQWAQKPALLLLERVVRTQPHVRVLGTARVPGPGLSDLLVRLRRGSAPVLQIELDGLGPGDVADALTALAGGELSPDGLDLAANLHLRTRGNPFFVREMVRHLEDTGAIHPSEGRWAHGIEGIPVGVHDLVGQRLAVIGARTAEALEAASVIGQEFDVDILASTLRWEVDDVLEALDATVSAGIVREDARWVDRYEFSHALVREALLDEVGLSRRSRLEWRAGQAIQSLRPSSGSEHATSVARHLAEGVAVGDAGEAVKAALAAGRSAVDGLAYEDAIGIYEHTLRCLDRSGTISDPDRADLLLAIGRAATPAGISERRREVCLEAVELARKIGDPERLAHAAVTLLGPLGPGFVDDAVAGSLEEAASGLRADLHPPGRRALLAEVLTRWSGYLADEQPEVAASLREEALGLARDAGDERTLALALMLSTAGFSLERDEHRSRLAEAEAIAREVGDAEVVLVAHSRLMSWGLTWGDRDAYDHHRAQYARVATTTRSPLHLLLSDVDAAGAAAIDGRYLDAREQAREALRTSRAFDDPNLAGTISLSVLPVNRELGRLAALEDRLRATMADGPHPPLGRAILAQALCAAGKPAEAGALLRAAVEDPAVDRGGELRRLTLTVLTEVAVTVGDVRTGAFLADRLEDERAKGDCVIVGPNAFFGALRRYLGLLSLAGGRPEEAVEHHEAALDLHERMRAVGWAARSRYDLARALIDRGDEGRAGELLKEAARTAEELGMPTLIGEIRDIQPP